MSDETRESSAGTPPKREMEQAPQLLRKASLVLIAGAILPWMTSISTQGHMPWTAWAIATALTLAGGFVMLEAAKANAGAKANGLVKSIAGAHPMAGTIVGLVLFVAALVVAWTMGSSYFVNGEFAGLTDAALVGAEDAKVEDHYSLRALLEFGTLFLGLATFAHIQAYEYGGKFNPIFPLMFLGPAVAGSLHVFTALGGDGSLKIVGILGSLIVAAAGIMAMYTMYVSMRQAKVEGDIKKAAERERRKNERSSRRS
ncbi:hypothetical protein Poly30_25380 [Planctomycetes bacterium Poly30]|uniref:Uncharacterized protein n=1 Tax=Saltatorellus ferox TaxID=2528018 RepID=A0A518ESF1_9BACT|nr:hypothetical protein Poly30_25380 [Planctomycetes bacterium Poly30]